MGDKKPGKTRGRGRPAGSRNKKSAALRTAIAAGCSPLDFLINTYMDEDKEFTVRLDAAKSAAPYCHAKLSSIDVTADVNLSDRQKTTFQLYSELLEQSAKS